MNAINGIVHHLTRRKANIRIRRVNFHEIRCAVKRIVITRGGWKEDSQENQHLPDMRFIVDSRLKNRSHIHTEGSVGIESGKLYNAQCL